MNRENVLSRGREYYGVSNIHLDVYYWDGIHTVRQIGSVDAVGSTASTIDPVSGMERSYPGWKPVDVAAQFRKNLLTGITAHL